MMEFHRTLPAAAAIILLALTGLPAEPATAQEGFLRKPYVGISYSQSLKSGLGKTSEDETTEKQAGISHGFSLVYGGVYPLESIPFPLRLELEGGYDRLSFEFANNTLSADADVSVAYLGINGIFRYEFLASTNFGAGLGIAVADLSPSRVEHEGSLRIPEDTIAELFAPDDETKAKIAGILEVDSTITRTTALHLRYTGSKYPGSKIFDKFHHKISFGVRFDL